MSNSCSCVPGVKESAGGGGGLLSRLSGAGLVGVARQVFLPEGYPESVSGDYLEYQAWDTAQVPGLTTDNVKVQC